MLYQMKTCLKLYCGQRNNFDSLLKLKIHTKLSLIESIVDSDARIFCSGNDLIKKNNFKRNDGARHLKGWKRSEKVGNALPKVAFKNKIYCKNQAFVDVEKLLSRQGECRWFNFNGVEKTFQLKESRGVSRENYWEKMTLTSKFQNRVGTFLINFKGSLAVSLTDAQQNKTQQVRKMRNVM